MHNEILRFTQNDTRRDFPKSTEIGALPVQDNLCTVTCSDMSNSAFISSDHHVQKSHDEVATMCAVKVPGMLSHCRLPLLIDRRPVWVYNGCREDRHRLRSSGRRQQRFSIAAEGFLALARILFSAVCSSPTRMRCRRGRNGHV